MKTKFISWLEKFKQREVETVFCMACFHLCVADWSNVTDGHVSISEGHVGRSHTLQLYVSVLV